MKKKRIIFCEQTGKGTGSAVSLRAILSLIDRNSLDIVLWFGDHENQSRWDGEVVYESSFKGLSNHDFGPITFSVRGIKTLVRFFLYSLRDIYTIPKILKKLNPDLLYINAGQPLLVGLIAKSMGIPIVWHIRELVAKNWIGHIQDRCYAYAANQIIAISNTVASRLPYSKKRGKVVQLYDAVGTMSLPSKKEINEFQKKFALLDTHLNVLLLGSVSKPKGYAFLADVADQLQNDRIKFVLAGTRHKKIWKDLQKIYDRWDELVKKGKAIFTGHIDPALAISSVDIIVCPNIVSEALGRTPLEAYKIGKPVIAMNLPPFNETIIDGESGWLLPMDINAWVEKFRELIKNPDLLTTLDSGIQTQQQKFDDLKYIKNIQNILNSVLN